MSVLAGVALLRIVGAVVVAGAPLAPAATEQPTSHSITVTATASFVDTTAPPQPLPAQGDLEVARSAVGNQAIAVLALDVPTGATSATITLRTSGQPGSSDGSPLISACRVTSPWSPGAAQAMSAAPAFDCTNVAPVGAGTSWTFDLEPLLRGWQDSPNLGVALVDTVSVTPAAITFNVIGSERVGTAVLPARPREPAPSPPATPAPLPNPQGAQGGNVAGPPPLTSVGPPPAPVPSPRPAPVVAPQATPRVVAQVAASVPLRVRPSVWFLIPLSVVLLVALVRVTSARADGLGHLVPA